MVIIVKISPSRWDTGSFHSADGHPSLFSFFSLRSLSLPCSPSSSSYRYPFASCIAFFALLLASLLSFAADNVFLPRCYTPPAVFASLSFFVGTTCADSSVSMSVETRLAYLLSIWYECALISPFRFCIFVWGIRLVSVIVCIAFSMYLSSSWGNIPLQRFWSLSCDRGLHCSDELMWDQQQQCLFWVDRTYVFRSMLFYQTFHLLSVWKRKNKKTAADFFCFSDRMWITISEQLCPPWPLTCIIRALQSCCGRVMFQIRYIISIWVLPQCSVRCWWWW